MTRVLIILSFFFFNDTATTEIYTLSLHDALPISLAAQDAMRQFTTQATFAVFVATALHAIAVGNMLPAFVDRSEEHTSELQSQSNLVCRLLLEKKKKKNKFIIIMRIEV